MTPNALSKVIRLVLLMWAAGVWLAGCGIEPGVATGSLQITSTPTQAEVYLNGEHRGQTPLVLRGLAPGEYWVRLIKAGYYEVTGTIQVLARQTSQVDARLELQRPDPGHRLAYVSDKDGTFEIWTIGDEGTAQQRWTAFKWPRPATALALSPDRNWLAATHSEPGAVTTWVVAAPRPQGQVSEAIPRPIGGDTFQLLQWFPDSRALLLRNTASQTLWTGSLLSGSVTPLNIPDVPRGITAANLSADGTIIAYASHDKTWLINVDGTQRQELAENGPAGNAYLRWSPDGTRIAHVRVQKSNPYRAGELWLMRASGALPQRIGLTNAQDFEPTWSPDVKRLVFVHRENPDDPTADDDPARWISNLWVFTPADQSLRSLTAFQGKRVLSPAVSPDSRRVAFVTNASGRDEIWLVDLDGGAPRQLTRDAAHASLPVWLW